MTIYHVLQGVDNPSAGPTYSVGALAHHLAMRQNNAMVVALGNAPTTWPYDVPLKIFNGRSVQYGLAPFSALRFVREEMTTASAVLHGHGLWRIANLFPFLLGNSASIMLVWSPRGMLSEWSWNYKAALKRPFWHLLQRPALRKVRCFHATAASECADIRRLGFTQPVAVIPNGVDVPHLAKDQHKQNRLVFLSRIHPKKGVHLLVEAWRAVADAVPDWELIVAGKLDSAYAVDLQTTSRNTGIPRLHFVGEVLGDRKTQLLASARLFVLPTYSENFGMAIAEALAHATPVITTVETPWTAIEGKECGWCIAPNASDLREILLKALHLPVTQLDAMGRNGREWMKGSFSWSRAADMMQELYAWMLNGGSTPHFVSL